MDTRVAIISVIVREAPAAEEINALLHQCSQYIIGRMGLPYRERQIHIISIAIDAPEDIINAFSGRIGRIPGVSSKVVYAYE